MGKQQSVPINNYQQPNPGAGTQVNLPTGRGIKTAWHAGSVAVVPPTANKKMKLDQLNHTLPTNVSTPLNTNTKKLGSALSDRLGFNMANIPGNASLSQNKIPQQTMNTSTPSSNINKVNLPVGVGIRFGRTTPSNSTTSLKSATKLSSGTLNTINQQNVNGPNTQWGIPTQQNQTNPAALLQPPPHVSNPFLRVWSGLVDGKAQSSEKAAAERRHRNREHAKRSRVRKKFLLESLQQQVSSLQKENLQLRMVVQTKIPQHAQKIISESCVKGALFDDSGKTDKTDLVKSDFTLMEHVTTGQQNFVLSDPRLPDNPIVYASEGFYKLTGYTQEQVLGRNCRFLQGPGTDPKAVDVIRTAVANGTDATTCVLNYKADGTPFWNQFFIAALRDSDNCIVNYVSIIISQNLIRKNKDSLLIALIIFFLFKK